MKTLGFRVRKNLASDGYIQLIIDSTVQDATFTYIKSEVVNTDSERYYKKPLIRISPSLYDIIFKQKDVTNKMYLSSQSILIHEITHYLQVADEENYYYIFKDKNPDVKRYFNQPSEFEAYSVGDYFFLKQYDKKALKNIMKQELDIHRKCELLINLFMHIDSAGGTYVFPK